MLPSQVRINFPVMHRSRRHHSHAIGPKLHQAEELACRKSCSLEHGVRRHFLLHLATGASKDVLAYDSLLLPDFGVWPVTCRAVQLPPE